MALGTTNISIRLVKETLPDMSNDVKGLCTSGNINKWAKYRPFHWTKSGSEDTTFLDLLVNNNWQGPTISYQAENGYGYYLTGKWCGFKPYILFLNSKEDFDYLKTVYTNTGEKLNGWTFLKPTGGAASPYRLGDFRNYEHGARCVFSSFNGPQNQPIIGNDIFLWIYYLPTTYLFELAATDFPALNDLYFGVAMKSKLSSDQWLLFSASKKWTEDGGNGVECNLSAEWFTGGRQYDLFPILCDKGGLSGRSWESMAERRPLCVTIPNLSSKTITVQRSEYAFELYARYVDSTPTTIKVYLLMSVSPTSKVTITNVRVYYDNQQSFPSSVSEYAKYTGLGQEGFEKIYYDATSVEIEQGTVPGADNKIVQMEKVKNAYENERYAHIQFTLGTKTYKLDMKSKIKSDQN